MLAASLLSLCHENMRENAHCQPIMRENDNFIDRLMSVLGDRKLYPWGMALGFSSATLARLKRGNSPKGETLAMIARAENASVSWLLTGQGPPYLVHRADTDADLAALLGSYLDDEDWRVDMLHDVRHAVLALTQPAVIGEGDDAVPYTALELCAGPIGPVTANAVRDRVHCAVRLSADQVRDLQTGRVGTWQILQILASGEDHGGQRVAELASQYDTGAFTRDEQILVEKYRSLPPGDRTRTQTIVDALAHAVDTDAEGNP